MGLLTSTIFYLVVLALLHTVAAVFALLRFRKPRVQVGDWCPPASLLKPLCGAESRLADNLLSFCDQDYPEYQIVSGVSHRADPAIRTFDEVCGARPDVEMVLVVDGNVRGQNHKVGNLQNMMRAAEHDILVISDSDICVGPDYLKRVVAPLEEPDVGLVTCLYRGRPVGGLWSQLGAMGINYGFLPSAVFGWFVGVNIGCFGATIAMRKDCLQECGGFDAIRDKLADDYALGEAVRKMNKRVVISDYVVDTIVAKPDFRSLWQQELRWNRTIHSVLPVGHVASIVSNPLPLAIIGTVVSGAAWPMVAMLPLALTARLVMTRIIDRVLGISASPLWLVPVRDLLIFATLTVGMFGSKVVWHDRQLKVASGGKLMASGVTGQVLFDVARGQRTGE